MNTDDLALWRQVKRQRQIEEQKAKDEQYVKDTNNHRLTVTLGMLVDNPRLKEKKWTAHGYRYGVPEPVSDIAPTKVLFVLPEIEYRHLQREFDICTINGEIVTHFTWEDK